MSKRRVFTSRVNAVTFDDVAWHIPRLVVKANRKQTTAMHEILVGVKGAAPHSFAVHDPSCNVGVFVMPLHAMRTEPKDVAKWVDARDAMCSCTPCVMRTGAVA